MHSNYIQLLQFKFSETCRKISDNEDFDEGPRAKMQHSRHRHRDNASIMTKSQKKQQQSNVRNKEQHRPSSRSSSGSRASSRLSTVSGTPQRQARYFENEIRRQQTHLRRLYAAAEWITTSANSVERTEIEAQISDVEYYIEDLEDHLNELREQSETSSSSKIIDSGDKFDDYGSREKRIRNGKKERRVQIQGSQQRPSSRHSFQSYISSDQ